MSGRRVKCTELQTRENWNMNRRENQWGKRCLIYEICVLAARPHRILPP